MVSSTYKIDIVIPDATPAAATNIINDLNFTDIDQFAPGGAGLLRVWFCFNTTAEADTVVSISHKASFADPEKLNPEVAAFAIKSGGLYRFDVPVELGDVFNIRSSVGITSVALLRIQYILFGA